MMVPIKCFSCGKVLADAYEEFHKRTQKGEQPGKVLDDLGIKRYCCRRMLLTQADLIDEIGKYKV